MHKLVPITFPGEPERNRSMHVSTVTADEAALIQADEDPAVDKRTRQHAANARLVHASIIAGGEEGMTLSDVLGLPYFSAFRPLQDATLIVNGFTEEKPATGEDKGDGQPKTTEPENTPGE